MQLNMIKNCPYPYHWCDGKHIPNMILRKDVWVDMSRTPDKEPCQHFIGNKCTVKSKNKGDKK